MENPQQQHRNRMSRGLLTEAERDFLRGDKTDVDPEGYRYNVRSRFRARLDELEKDIQLLEEAGEDDLVDEFHRTFDKVERLQQRVDSLEKQIDDD
jgi:hypothetical protein